ncbi:MAG: 5'/3'-nucleotidase SurE [Asticcacaulis sp.]
MRILLTNDDGIEAYGLSVLYDLARTLTDDVWIVAPVVEQSGKGRGVTLHEPLRVKRLGDKRFAVSGTPTDCVQIAVNDLMDHPPDLLLSGINRGFNPGAGRDAVGHGGRRAARHDARHPVDRPCHNASTSISTSRRNGRRRATTARRSSRT